MPTELKDIVDEVKSISHKLNEKIEAIDKEQKRMNDDLTSKTAQFPMEYKQSIDRINTDLNALMAEFRNFQLAASKPGVRGLVANYDSPAVKQEAKKAFIAALKSVAIHGPEVGLNRLTEEEKKYVSLGHLAPERKAMYNSDATTGGFFAMPEFMNDLIKDIVLLSPFRSVATTYQISNAWLELPKRTSVASAYWAVEQATFTKSTDAKLGLVKIYPHEIRGLLQISLQNMEDSVFDIESFVQNELAEQFAYTEGVAFCTGDGNEKPEGVMTNTSVTSTKTGSNTAITADTLLKAMHALKSVYRANATWIFTTATLGNLRLMKDSQNRPLWQPFAAGGLPATIYDRPYVEMPAMDDAAADYTYTQNQYPVAIGDFKRAYVIADRIQMSVTRLSELYAESGLVGFIARKRVGGQVVLPQAIQKLKVTT